MKKRAQKGFYKDIRGFSLLEILVSTTILLVVVSLTFGVMSHLSKVWQKTRSDIDAFQAARNSFSQITRNLSQATLNPYWAYQRDANENPVQYVRRSDLHFVSGWATDTLLANSVTHGILFQVPAGRMESGSLQRTSNLLCVLGYYIAFESDSTDKAAWLKALPGSKEKYRFRLMEIEQPAEKFQVFQKTEVQPTWLGNTVSRPIDDNCIALILSPRLTDKDDPEGDDLAPNYTYNSRVGASTTPQALTANQLPPCVIVTLIAISEKSAARLTQGENSPEALKNKITEILSGRFQTVTTYASDLDAVTKGLMQNNIDYRVFSTVVPLRESKWSQ